MAIVELITAVTIGAILMEAPHWHIPSQTLYFVDILKGEISCYDTNLNQQFTATIPGFEGLKIGFITPVQDRPNTFVVGIMNKLELINWEKTSTSAQWLSTLAEFDLTYNETTRFNDGKADRTGRVYAGTMIDEEFGSVDEHPIGSLYRYAPSTRDLGQLKSSLKLSNGLAWNDVTNKFYFIDSLDYNIIQFDYDEITGNIINERVLVDFKDNGQPPLFIADGMTIDANGDLWVALFNGGRVLKVNGTSGDILDEIEIPGVPAITSVAFGGPGLDELYVTTGSYGGLPPPSGGLFRIRELGVRGLEMYNVKLS